MRHFMVPAIFLFALSVGACGEEDRKILGEEQTDGDVDSPDADDGGDPDEPGSDDPEEPDGSTDDLLTDDLLTDETGKDADTAPDADSPLIPVDPYGILMASGIFPLIYNGDGDLDAQVNNDMNGLVNQPVFTGTYGKKKKPIPGEPTEVVDAFTMSIAVRYGATAESPAIITVSQSTQDSTMALVNPAVSFTLSVDGLEQGEHPLGFDPKGPDNIYLVNSINNDTDYCLLALSIGGTVTVTAAKDTDQPYGASLSFVGAQIPVFHPTETPVGDVVEQLVDIPICPKE